MILITFLAAVICFKIVTLFLVNLYYFRRSPRIVPTNEFPSISVLIPARNEAKRIEALLTSVSDSEGVQLEICVLDDQSKDATAEIVRAFAARQSNVRLISGLAVPAGWNGKQYACYQLAGAAAFDEIVFIDADVSLAKDALLRAVTLRRATGVSLLSGFPIQRVVTLGESLLIPLIHLILLCFLPFPVMRFSNRRSAAAGCGQLFLTTKNAYSLSGGHAAIRSSLHDGLTLPRAYRTAGLSTDLFDASDIASCRMYESFHETWRGLSKNAHEGFANMPLLLAITPILYLAFIHPVAVIFCSAFFEVSTIHWSIAVFALILGYLPRIVCCIRYDHAWLGCLLNPVSIAMFLVIQWEAWFNRLRGRSVEWRSRTYETTTP